MPESDMIETVGRYMNPGKWWDEPELWKGSIALYREQARDLIEVVLGVVPSLTAEQYENVAWALDSLTKIGRSLLEPIAVLDGDIQAEVTIQLTTNGEPMSKKEALTLLAWLDGDDMQRDLRAMAAQLRDTTEEE